VKRLLRRGPAADRLIRWAALPITNRRWAAPLSAVALGFGLFIGVAIGPGASGTFAGARQVIEIPDLGGEGEAEAGETRAGGPSPAGGSALGATGGEAAPFPEAAPLAEEPLPTLTPVEGGQSRSGAPASADEGDAPAEPESQDGESEEPLLGGTVVHVNPAAGSYTVAEEGGVMSAVHAGKRPALGTQVEVPIRTLANGTLVEAGKRKATGDADTVSLAGIVTFVDPNPAAPAYALSNRGTSPLIRVHPDPNGVPVALPALGAYATVSAEIEKPQPGASVGGLWQSSLSTGGAPFTHADLAGIVAAIHPETAQLAISADDVRADGQDLLLAVPPTIDVSRVAVGESVLAGADIGPGGSLVLTGLASDEHAKGADDEAPIQGDLVPAKVNEGASR
jgi:hypothetical protein